MKFKFRSKIWWLIYVNFLQISCIFDILYHLSVLILIFHIKFPQNQRLKPPPQHQIPAVVDECRVVAFEKALHIDI